MGLHKDLTGTNLHGPGYVQTSDPGSVADGQYWFNPSTGILKIRDSSAWVTVLTTGLAASTITSGQLATARGGTGIDASAAANGELFIGNGSGLTKATLTAGTNVTITNGAGSITIAASGGGGGGTSTAVAVHVSNSGNIALTSGSFTTLTFDTERNDTDGFHSTVTNTSRLTVPSGKAGYYQIGGNVGMTQGAGYRGLRLLLNGTTVIGYILRPGHGTYDNRLQVEAFWNLSVADYVELQGFVDESSRNALADANASPDFWMYLVGT